MMSQPRSRLIHASWRPCPGRASEQCTADAICPLTSREVACVLLGLPVAAAATAKAVVSGSNNGRGPVAPDSQHAAAMADQAARVYTRKSLDPKVKGFFAGVAELISADDGTVAWADMQYVVFTLITLVYFVVQVLARPGQGLPPVPAALLTLMGVSASGYTASKIVETKGNTQEQAKQG
jgi:hypothetical protein